MRLLAVAVALQLTAGLLAAALVSEPVTATSPVPGRITVDQRLEGAIALDSEPVAAPQRQVLEDERDKEVERLLRTRTAAILGRNREAFLATVDPRAQPLQARQAAMFDALAEVPLGTWDYRLDATSDKRADPELDQRYGRGQWWAPAVSLSYMLAGFDDRPTVDQHHLTFVRRDGSWLLGADDDFAASGAETTRALWDRGPVAAVRAPGVLALGHDDSPLLRNVAAVASDAIPRVNAVWGTQWSQKIVVIVPSTTRELSSLLESTQDFSQIAAVASAKYEGSPDPDATAVDRVLVNPETFPKLGQLGRRVVLTHEVTHVAARRATGPAMPAWLAEGFADYVGYKGLKVPLDVAARDLRKDVRAGRLPTALPADDAFSGGSASLAQAYEQSWLAVRLLVERFGEGDVVRFYRAVGASRGVAESVVLTTELQEEFGIDTATFVAEWRSALQRQLG